MEFWLWAYVVRALTEETWRQSERVTFGVRAMVKVRMVVETVFLLVKGIFLLIVHSIQSKRAS